MGINVCFAGITGWAAAPIVTAIGQADDMALTSGVSRSAAGQSLAAVTGVQAGAGSVYGTVSEALESASADVLVDYTSATAVKANVWAAVEAGIHAVIGSSGLTAGDYEELDRLARYRRVGAIAAGNFSIMAAVLRRAAVMAAGHLDRWEVIDYASDTKSDVPVAPRGSSRRPWRTPASPRSRWRSQTCTGLSRRVARRWRVPASTRCACPASWSPPRSCSGDPANDSSCVMTQV